MASKKLERTILNIFEPNITESITANDLQIFTSAIFQASESVIHKFDAQYDVDDFRLSNPSIPIYKNDIVIMKGSEKAGIYLVDIDQPFFKDLTLVANLNQDIGEILNVDIKNPIDGDTLIYNEKYQQWTNKSENEKNILQERPRLPHNGMMYFDTFIEKPIWYNAKRARWVDALGQIV